MFGITLPFRPRVQRRGSRHPLPRLHPSLSQGPVLSHREGQSYWWCRHQPPCEREGTLGGTVSAFEAEGAASSQPVCPHRRPMASLQQIPRYRLPGL